jgi:hypothetical protein
VAVEVVSAAGVAVATVPVLVSVVGVVVAVVTSAEGDAVSVVVVGVAVASTSGEVVTLGVAVAVTFLFFTVSLIFFVTVFFEEIFAVTVMVQLPFLIALITPLLVTFAIFLLLDLKVRLLAFIFVFILNVFPTYMVFLLLLTLEIFSVVAADTSVRVGALLNVNVHAVITANNFFAFIMKNSFLCGDSLLLSFFYRVGVIRLRETDKIE